MNKQINFEQFGGYPLTQDDLGWMQDSYTKAISAFAVAFGPYVILNGVEEQNGYYNDGWVIIDKVLLPFRKSQIAAGIAVNETKNNRLFANGATYDVLSEKYATSANTGGIAISNFVRIKPYAQHMSSTDSAIYNSQQDIYNLQQAVAGMAQVPKGMISMWSGSVTALPAGWGLCDGSNGTPDLRGRFVVGYTPNDANYNSIGKTGGATTVVLTEGQLPTIRPKWKWDKAQKSDTGDGRDGNHYVQYHETYTKKNLVATDQYPIESFGKGEAHENRPPYYTLAYIMKL